MDEHRDLLMMNADGTNIHTIKEDVDYSPSAWMPDGSAIIASAETGTVLVDPATGADTMMVAGVLGVRASPNSGLVAYESGGALFVNPSAPSAPL